MSRGSVVHVVRSDAFAGVERYIADTASALAARGWRVTVVGGDPARMRDQLAAGVAHRPAATVREVARGLWSVGRADIVHAHMTAAELPAAVLKKRLGARLVVTRHFASPRGRSLPGRLAAHLIERRIDLQVATSQFVAAATATPSTVIYSGVRPGVGSAARAKVVLMLQRLEAEKDTATAIRAWAESGLGATGWRLVIHGKGSQEQSLRRLARELQVEDTVEFAGFTDDPRAALRSAAMFLAPAVSDAFGLAIVEAMAEGTPVVATRAGAHPETLGDNGAYFAVGDVAECAAQLSRLASDPAGRAAVGHELQERQRRQFSVDGHADALERAYSIRLK